VTEKKPKVGTVENGKIKKEKKKKKERRKHKEEHRDRAHVKRRKKVKQSSSKFIAVVPTTDITSKKRSKIGSKEDLISKTPLSNKTSVDALFGRFKNRSYNIGMDVIEKNVNSVAINNEIKPGKLHPLLHTLENEKIIGDNKIPLFEMKEVPKFLGINSAPEYDKIHDAYISEKEKESERAKLLPEVPSITPSKSIIVGSTDAETWLHSSTKKDIGLIEQSNTEIINSLEVFKFVNITEESDWSCLHDMFLPAPHVANAEVRYTR
jgi:hypothetical protein